MNGRAVVWTLSMCGIDADAINAAEPALLVSGRGPRVLAELAAIYARRGDRQSAEAIFEELRHRSRTGYIGCSEQRATAAAAGHLEQPRILVARGRDGREPYLLFHRSSPAWEPFRTDPEGQKLLRGVEP